MSCLDIAYNELKSPWLKVVKVWLEEVSLASYCLKKAEFGLTCLGNIKSRPAQPAKIDLNKKSLPKQKTIQNFIIDA